MSIIKLFKLADKFEEKLKKEDPSSSHEEQKGCSECNDVHCCMNYDTTHEVNYDTNDAKCTGTKHSPVGSPRQRAFCARHCGMKKHRTSPAVAKDPESCINKGLRRWKCRCG